MLVNTGQYSDNTRGWRAGNVTCGPQKQYFESRQRKISARRSKLGAAVIVNKSVANVRNMFCASYNDIPCRGEKKWYIMHNFCSSLWWPLEKKNLPMRFSSDPAVRDDPSALQIRIDIRIIYIYNYIIMFYNTGWGSAVNVRTIRKRAAERFRGDVRNRDRSSVSKTIPNDKNSSRASHNDDNVLCGGRVVHARFFFWFVLLGAAENPRTIGGPKNKHLRVTFLSIRKKWYGNVCDLRKKPSRNALRHKISDRRPKSGPVVRKFSAQTGNFELINTVYGYYRF